jgi:hypothetical protein
MDRFHHFLRGFRRFRRNGRNRRKSSPMLGLVTKDKSMRTVLTIKLSSGEKTGREEQIELIAFSSRTAAGRVSLASPHEMFCHLPSYQDERPSRISMTIL